MIDQNKMVKIVNKFNGVVGYNVPELGVNRTFYPKESKNVSFNELEKLSYLPGGESILKNYLEIMDKEAIMALFNEEFEPEYYYSEEDVKKLLTTGSLDQFLDCLDFAPAVIIEMVKQLAVNLPVNDIAKREAIKEKTGFDVTKAIEIKNTKYDGGDESDEATQNTYRRTTPIKTEKMVSAPTGRRYQSTK